MFVQLGLPNGKSSDDEHSLLHSFAVANGSSFGVFLGLAGFFGWWSGWLIGLPFNVYGVRDVIELRDEEDRRCILHKVHVVICLHQDDREHQKDDVCQKMVYHPRHGEA